MPRNLAYALHCPATKQYVLTGAPLQMFDVAIVLKFTPRDALICIDMQNDFMPGGSFAVKEADQLHDMHVAIIYRVHAGGATIVASRDAHTHDHCSFLTHGGLFPPHCIQGTVGSFIVEKIADALDKVEACIVHKGHNRDVDSFGAVMYTEEMANGRLARANSCSLDFTGSYSLDCVVEPGRTRPHPNAHPYILAWSQQGNGMKEKKSLSTILGGIVDLQRIFVFGVALDFCVLDTARTIRASGFTGEIFIILDGSRPAHMPTGELCTSPRAFIKLCEESRIKLVMSAMLDENEAPLAPTPFPEALGPLLCNRLRCTEPQIRLPGPTEGSGLWQMTVTSGEPYFGQVSALCPMGGSGFDCTIFGRAELPEGDIGFLYPAIDSTPRAALGLSDDVKCLLKYGGLVVRQGSTLTFWAFVTEAECRPDTRLCVLDQPVLLPAEGTEEVLRAAGALQEVTLQFLKDARALEFGWYSPAVVRTYQTVSSSGAPSAGPATTVPFGFIYKLESPSDEPLPLPFFRVV